MKKFETEESSKPAPRKKVSQTQSSTEGKFGVVYMCCLPYIIFVCLLVRDQN